MFLRGADSMIVFSLSCRPESPMILLELIDRIHRDRWRYFFAQRLPTTANRAFFGMEHSCSRLRDEDLMANVRAVS